MFWGDAQTHLQELVEEAEGVHVVQTVVAQPVPKLAVIAQLVSVPGFVFVFQVTVGAFPLQLLRPSPPQPAVEPAVDGQQHASHVCVGVCVRARRETHVSGDSRLHVRAGELEDVADGLFEDHDDGHLDEEVRQTSAGVALGRDKVHHEHESSLTLTRM